MKDDPISEELIVHARKEMGLEDVTGSEKKEIKCSMVACVGGNGPPSKYWMAYDGTVYLDVPSGKRYVHAWGHWKTVAEWEAEGVKLIPVGGEGASDE